MALMYFRLPGGDLGWVEQTPTGWRFEKVSASGPRAAILGFEALIKSVS